VGTWHDTEVRRPIAAPLERCAEMLDIDLATVRELAAGVEPYVRADGTKVWSLMLLERQLRPERFGRRRGGYLDRRRTAFDTADGRELEWRRPPQTGQELQALSPQGEKRLAASRRGRLDE
jgi:hypothetical protein